MNKKGFFSKNKSIRKAMQIVEQSPNTYLLSCLFVSSGIRKIFYNYTFRKKELLNKLSSNDPLPRNLYIEGTNICNSNCVFCAYDKLKRPKTIMPMELFIDIINQYVSIGGKAIGLTPIVGDPCMDRHLLERIHYVDSIKQIRNIGFYTNSIALDKDKVDGIFEVKDTIINLSVSFGGYDSDTFKTIMGVDKFDTVRENINYLLDKIENQPNKNVVVKIDFRCPNEIANDTFFHRLNKFIDDKKIKHETLGGRVDSFGGLIDKETIEAAGLSYRFPSPKLGPCDIVFRKPLVLADGRINACAERDLEASLIIGDTKEQSLKEIFTGQKKKDFIQSFYEHKYPNVCKKCSVYQSIYDLRSKVWKNNLSWAKD
ncbi:MAG: radical SAM protein [Nitrospirae bacterium]|nr:radical SAM protein [Nitrospirota bacterium]